jgi:hypothetical protein
LFGLGFDHEYWGGRFLGNVDTLLPDYTASYPRRMYTGCNINPVYIHRSAVRNRNAFQSDMYEEESVNRSQMEVKQL